MIQTRDGKVYRVEHVFISEIIENSDYRYGIANALQATRAKKLQPQTCPKVLDLRLACENFEDPIWELGFDTISGIYNVGRDVVVVHGEGHPLANDQRIRGAIDEGLVECAARLTAAEVQAFKKGRIVKHQVHYEDLLAHAEKVLVEPFAVRAERVLFKRLPNDYLTLSKWPKDPRTIIFSGSRQKAEQYADALGRKGVKEAWLSLDVKEDLSDRGRVLYVGSYDNYGSYVGLNGDNFLDGDGRVLAVAPEAHVAKNLSLEARTA